MAHYVEIPSSVLESFLSEKGFVPYVRGAEIVYERGHVRNPHVKVLVYTSIREGARNARACGADAIRVCTIYENEGKSKRFGIGKFPRIYRVTSVEGTLERMLLAMRAAYVRGTEWINANPENKGNGK